MIISQLNFEKLLFNPELLIKLKAETPFPPPHLTLSLTNFCNHKCIWCTVYEYQKQKAKHINVDKLLKFLSLSEPKGLKAVTYVGNGEPTLHSSFAVIIPAVSKLGIEQGIFTNGTNLAKFQPLYLDHFSFLRVSLDAYSDESHHKTHGINGAFSGIIDSIKQICKLKKQSGSKLQIGIQFVFHPENIDGIDKIGKIACQLGTDYLSFKPAFNRGATFVRGYRNNLTLRDVSEEIGKVKTKYARDDFKVFFREFQVGSVDVNNLDYSHCYGSWLNLNVYEDGKISECGPQRIHVGTIGDSPDDIFEKIRHTYQGLDLSKCPGGCRYHPFNRLVHLLKNPQERTFLNEFFL